MVKLITGRIPMRYASTSNHKDKPADCVYLAPDRTCTNQQSTCYADKCFRASWCTLKVKSKDKCKLTPKGYPVNEQKSKKYFVGIKEISLSDIHILKEQQVPRQETIECIIEKYNKKKQYNQIVILRLKEDTYYLQKRYASFYVAKMLGLEKVKAVVLTKGQCKMYIKVTKIGNVVEHSTFGKGVVKSLDENILSVEFYEHGLKRIALFDCIQKGTLSIAE